LTLHDGVHVYWFLVGPGGEKGRATREEEGEVLGPNMDWMWGSVHGAKEAEKVIGMLNHVCLVVPEGRSRMVSLYKFRGGFRAGQHQEVKHKLGTMAGEDMDWWRG
jgi:hypothetical protein